MRKKSDLHERFLSSRKADYSVFVPAAGNFSRGVHGFSFLVVFFKSYVLQMLLL